MMRGLTRLTRVIRGFASNAGNSASTAALVDPLKNVVGLTSKCVNPNEAKNVPGTGKEYKAPEYFGYDRMSYHEAEVEMQKFRIPQPVAPRK